VRPALLGVFSHFLTACPARAIFPTHRDTTRFRTIAHDIAANPHDMRTTLHDLLTKARDFKTKSNESLRGGLIH
jgi:hypothetical protein